MSGPQPSSNGPTATPRSTAGAPGRSSAQIRHDLEIQRSELSASVEELRRKVNDLTDWRKQVREHRTELITVAAVAGFVIGGLLAIRRRR
ncbi:MAG: DUF3618 domain-containing protein [Solirubrobacterales bacterium]